MFCNGQNSSPDIATAIFDTTSIVQATNPVLFDFIIIAVSIVSGCFGAMLGLGGGVILIPVLVSVLGVDVKTAIAASLVAVITTSGAAALVRGRDSMSNCYFDSSNYLLYNNQIPQN